MAFSLYNMEIQMRIKIKDKINFITAGFTIIYLIVPCLIYYEVSNKDWAKAGQIGDTFGIINAFFSLVSFIYLLYSIQNQEEENEKQFKSIKIQNFENTFFNLLSNLNEITSLYSLTYDTKNNLSVKGKNVFRHLINVYKSQATGNKLIIPIFKFINKESKEDYELFYRNIHIILDFIETSDIDEKQKYSNIFINSFTNPELWSILLYYLYCSESIETLRLFKKYKFFKNIKKNTFDEFNDNFESTIFNNEEFKNFF